MDNIEKKYKEILEKEIPQRNKGLPYEKILGTSVVSIMIFCFFGFPLGGFLLGYRNFIEKNFLSIFLIYFLLVLISVWVPQLMTDDVKNSNRKTKRKYPDVYDAIISYEYRLIDEKMKNGLNPLIINGQTYFLGVYTRPNSKSSEIEISGYVVCNDKNEIISDREIFKKAFHTFNYGIIGTITGQRSSNRDYSYFREITKVYIPRIGKYLSRKKKFFSRLGNVHEYELIMGKYDICSVVGNEIINFLKNREKFRVSLGYSFAYEYCYEDALLEYDLRNTFYQYIKIKYYEDIDEIRKYTDSILEDLRLGKRTLFNLVLQRRILRIYNYSVRVINFINNMKYQGIPSDEDYRLFELKNKYVQNNFARNRNAYM
jgi:hypothetical protein